MQLHRRSPLGVQSGQWDAPHSFRQGVRFTEQILDDRTAHNPEQQLMRYELSTRILSALERLTPRERMVFDLKHFQGMKLRTVSEILNTSESSVKTSLMRATQKLRLQLAKYTKPQKSSMKRCCDQRDVSQTAIPKNEKEVMATATYL